MRRLSLTAGILVLFVLAVPQAARAQGYIAPFIGWDFGGDAGKCPALFAVDCSRSRTSYGVSLGGLSHGLFGGEIDFGYAPHFFGDNPVSGSSVWTFMGHIILAIPAGPVHPYVSGGLGFIRTKVDQVEGVTDFSERNFAYNLGAGLLVMLPAHVGFRIDYRYMTTTSDISPAAQPLLTTGQKLNFSRIAFALVLH